MDLRSTPIKTLSLDISKSAMVTTLRFCRAAQSAASFTRLARSAPEKPGVPRAITERSTSSEIGTLRVCTRRISSRPLMSGRGTTTRRSNRPGRNSAGSSTSGRFVAAIRMTPSFDSKPSISTSRAFKRLLALIVTAAQAGAAVAADGVDFIDEDDAGRVLLALLEEVAHAAGAHADEHLHEIGAGNGEKRNVGLAGNGACQQGFARSRRSDQQHAFGNAAAQLLKLLRIFQEFDDLLQFFLGLIDSRYVLEGGLLLLRGQQTRPRFTEAQRLIAARLHLPHHDDPEAHQQKQRRRGEQEIDPVGASHFLDVDQNALVAQFLGEIGSALP